MFMPVESYKSTGTSFEIAYVVIVVYPQGRTRIDSLLPSLRLSALSVFLDKLKVCCLVDLRQLLMFGAFYDCFSFF